MKANKKLLISAMALGLAGLTTVGSTYAWFSMNRTVTAEGMQLKSTTPASLVISTGTPVGEATNVTFNTAATVLTPVTHKSSLTAEETGSTAVAATSANLAYITNGKDVDAGTGYGKKSGENTVALKYADAVNNTPSGTNYYVDYKVFIASSGSKLESQDLSAVAYTDKDVTTDTMYQAASIDFYVLSTGSSGTINTTGATTSNYVGTINFKGAAKDSDSTSLTYNKYVATSAVVYTGDIDVPKGNYLTIIMRVYFDGNLDDGSGKAFVRNNNVKVDAFGLGVQFTASDKTTGN